MKRLVALVAFSLVFLLQPTEATLAGGPKTPKIADNSDWDVVITHASGAKQTAIIRIRNGVIWSGANKNTVGTFDYDNEGYLHIYFNGHPKVPSGEAILEQPAARRWTGYLNSSTGEAEISMKRK